MNRQWQKAEQKERQRAVIVFAWSLTKNEGDGNLTHLRRPVIVPDTVKQCAEPDSVRRLAATAYRLPALLDVV